MQDVFFEIAVILLFTREIFLLVNNNLFKKTNVDKNKRVYAFF